MKLSNCLQLNHTSYSQCVSLKKLIQKHAQSDERITIIKLNLKSTEICSRKSLLEHDEKMKS